MSKLLAVRSEDGAVPVGFALRAEGLEGEHGAGVVHGGGAELCNAVGLERDPAVGPGVHLCAVPKDLGGEVRADQDLLGRWLCRVHLSSGCGELS